MAYTATALIKLAEAEVGYLEKESNSNLDSKTANAGDNNYTKYARDLFDAGYYNGNKNGYAWCDCFVDWLFYQLCGKNAKKAQDMICQTGNLGAGCIYSAQYYRNAGRFYTSPKVGDQIFFGPKGDEGHTGIVYAVDATTVYTIEGNTSGASGVVANGGGVFKKAYSRSYSQISGYGRPKYDAETATTTAKPTGTSDNVKKFQQACLSDRVSVGECGVDGIWGKDTEAAANNILVKGCKGERVRVMQERLKTLGYDLGTYGADGDYGSATEKAVNAFKKKIGLPQNGRVGVKVWKALLGV